MNYKMRHLAPSGASSILPLGKVTISSGRSKYFNIYETWANDNTTWELYNSGSTLKLVATSGTSPINNKPRREFQHDQTGRYLGSWEFIGSTLQANLKQFASANGFTKIDAYTYK